MGGAMPILDFANPIYTFPGGAHSYTTTKECYLYIGRIVAGSSGNALIYVDGTTVSGQKISTSDMQGFCGVLKLKAGSVVSTSSQIHAEAVILILDEV